MASTPRKHGKRGKRARGSPTGKTPMQIQKKASGGRCRPTSDRCSPKRILTYSTDTRSREPSRSLYTPVTPWTTEEDKSLIKFVLLYGSADKWPSDEVNNILGRSLAFCAGQRWRKKNKYVLTSSLSLSHTHTHTHTHTLSFVVGV